MPQKLVGRRSLIGGIRKIHTVGDANAFIIDLPRYLHSSLTVPLAS